MKQMFDELQARRSNFESGGALIPKEAPSWLGPTDVENFSKLGPLDRLKLTPNSKIFHSKAFIKQEFVEIKKRICNVIKI